jgi:DNA-directed RNA polymerase subunit beta'
LSVQNLEVDRRHLEVVVSRMFQWVTVRHPGDTDLVAGRIMVRRDFRHINQGLPPNRRARAVARLSGLSEIARRSGFLSGLLVHDPAEMLSCAALARREESLTGLHVNALRGDPIPAGTGFTTEAAS